MPVRAGHLSVAPFVLPAPRGDILVGRWYPTGPAPESVLFLPPLAEELNKCRAMMALAARQLALSRWQVLLPDLRGTGDSEGDFSDARVGGWLEDLIATAEWARDNGQPVTALIAVRAGALLAANLLPAVPELRRLALWQPVTSGRQWLRQFLRLRVASGRLAGDATETVETLSADLARGKPLEVAGYHLSPELATDLGRLQIAGLEPPAGASLCWFEVSSAPDAGLSLPARQWLAGLTASGHEAIGRICEGPAFWASVEVTTSPDLCRATTSFVADDRARPALG